MKKKKFIMGAGFILTLMAHQLQAQTPSENVGQNDFAYTADLSFAKGAGLVRFDLNDEVYAHVEGARLEDLRLFNAKGEDLPYVIWQQKTTAESKTESVDLPFFPIVNLNQEGVLQKLTTTQSGNQRVSEESLRKLYNEQTNGFLLDARALKSPVSALQLVLGDLQMSSLHNLAVEGSDDLQRWTPLNPHATIGKFVNGENVLVHDKITFMPHRFAYYRVLLLDEMRPEDAGQLIRGAVAETVSSEIVPVPFVQKNVKGKIFTSEKAHVFDLGGALPLQQLDVETSNPNYYWKIHLYSSPENTADIWNDHGQMKFYRVTDLNHVIQSESLQLRSRDRYWKVVFEEGSFPFDDFSLNVFYQPETVVFMPQGEAPFTLAFGCKNLEPAHYDLGSLLNLSGSPSELQALTPAELGTPKQQRSEAQDVRKIKQAKIEAEKHKKSWIVWAVLLAGLGLMGFMALSLFRQMNKK